MHCDIHTKYDYFYVLFHGFKHTCDKVEIVSTGKSLYDKYNYKESKDKTNFFPAVFVDMENKSFASICHILGQAITLTRVGIFFFKITRLPFMV